MIKYIFLLVVFLPYYLNSQSNPYVLDKLKAGETLRIEWVHQQYLPDSGSVVGNYPLFPDQMKDGEGESFVGLKLEMEDCPTSTCLIKVWVEYVSTVAFPNREKYNPDADVFKPNTPPTAMLFPKMEDTRYISTTGQLPAFSLGKLKETFALVDINTGIQDSSWIANSVNKNTLPESFNQYYLQRFLNNLWQVEWSEKEHFQKVEVFELFDKVSVNFFKPVHPSQKTVLTGTILSPRVTTVNVTGLLEGSHKSTWGQSNLTLDENGAFSIITNLDKPALFYIMHELNGLVLYLEPGDSLHLEIDANAFYRKVKFTGNQLVSNQFLLDFYHEMRGDTILDGLDRHLLKKTQLSFLKEVQQKEKKELAYLVDYHKPLSLEFITHFERDIRLKYADKIWYHAIGFYAKKDAAIHPEYLAYSQSLRKLFFRLPEDNKYDFNLDQYLGFQAILLQGAYTQAYILDRQPQFFQLAKMLFSTKNAFRVGRFLLAFGSDFGDFLRLETIYEELKVICQDKKDLMELEDFKNPNLKLPPMQGIKALPVGWKAPDWAFDNLEGNIVKSTDFRGDYFLLHIGFPENLVVAQKDLLDIKKEIGTDLPIISLVQEALGKKEEQLYHEGTIFISPTEMQILRDSYLIENKGNNFYLVDSAGIIAASPLGLNSFHKLKSTISALPQEKEKTSWQPSPIFWRNLGISTLFLLVLGAIYTQRKRTLAKREQQKRQLVELELKGIRAQMNPHFLFNALSSIQNLIRKKEAVAADRYLTQFAGLVRKILRNSEQEFITLEEELAAIKQYCSLEALRTPFKYELTIAEEIDAFNTYIPGMLIQPLVENAILHGLMPQQGERNLWITIKLHSEGLACEIMDNGIGIQKAQRQKQRHKAHQKSFGMTLIKQRLSLLLNQPEATFLTLQDRSKLMPPATGTIVNLVIPIEK